MKSTDRGRDPLPESFRSEEEAANFWDTHSVADYEDFLEPAEVEVDIKSRRFEIEVEESVFRELAEQAKSAHKSVKELASQILYERLASV
jgi:predicted HicB family RNase H-like nuclease